MPISTINQNGLTNPLTSLASNTVGSASGSALTLQSNGGTTAVTIDTSQRVGIGTSSPGARLELGSATDTSTLRFRSTFTSFGSVADISCVGTANETSQLTFATRNLGGAVTERMRIDSSGNVGIGTSSPNNVMTTYRGAGVNNYIQFTNATTGTASTDGCLIGVSADDTALRLRVLEAAPMLFTTSDTERMRIAANGDVLVGVTSWSPTVAGLRFDGPSAAQGRILSTCNNDFNIELYGSQVQRIGFGASNSSSRVGSITVTTTNTAYNTSSDYRLKENIAPMTGALAKVQQLKPCTYTWKVDGSQGEGFIAHELAEVVPQAVTGEKDAVEKDGSIKPQQIDTSFLVATLTAAIQELKAEFDEYKRTHP